MRWGGDEEVESVGMYICTKTSQETLLFSVETAFFPLQHKGKLHSIITNKGREVSLSRTPFFLPYVMHGETSFY